MIGMSKTGNSFVLKPTTFSYLMFVLPRKVEALKREKKKKRWKKQVEKKRNTILNFKKQVLARK